MKKILLAGLLLTSAVTFGMTHNEEVSADIDISLRVRQPLSLTIERGSVDFGLLARGDEKRVNPIRGNERALGRLEGEAGTSIVASFSDNQEDENIQLIPRLAVDGVRIFNGGSFVLLNREETEKAYAELGFGATVKVQDTAKSGDIIKNITYTFKYQ